MLITDSSVGNYITIKSSKYSFFGGNNYLGLASNTSVINASIRSVKKYGVNFSASRQTTGTSEIHLELERLLSEFKNKSDSVVYASGYMGNKILLTALRGLYNAVYIDDFAHPSIHDGIPNDVTNRVFYKHCDCMDLEVKLKENTDLKPLIITDGVFALTGEVAPLDEIYYLAVKYKAILVTDDAHSTGILGKNGRGTPEYFHLDEAPDIYQSETLSKALGAYGGFISGGEELISNIREKSNIYLGSTALPPPLVSAACESLRIIRKHPELRKRLSDNTEKTISGIKELGFRTYSDHTPIIPLLFNSQKNAEQLSEFLKHNNIIVPFIQYPVKTDKFIIRITVSASHKKEQIEELLQVLKKWGEKNEADKY